MIVANSFKNCPFARSTRSMYVPLLMHHPVVPVIVGIAVAVVVVVLVVVVVVVIVVATAVYYIVRPLLVKLVVA